MSLKCIIFSFPFHVELINIFSTHPPLFRIGCNLWMRCFFLMACIFFCKRTTVFFCALFFSRACVKCVVVGLKNNSALFFHHLTVCVFAQHNVSEFSGSDLRGHLVGCYEPNYEPDDGPSNSESWEESTASRDEVVLCSIFSVTWLAQPWGIANFIEHFIIVQFFCHSFSCLFSYFSHSLLWILSFHFSFFLQYSVLGGLVSLKAYLCFSLSTFLGFYHSFLSVSVSCWFCRQFAYLTVLVLCFTVFHCLYLITFSHFSILSLFI